MTLQEVLLLTFLIQCIYWGKTFITMYYGDLCVFCRLGLISLLISHCSLGRCLICWCMHHNVVLHFVSTQIVARWRGFFAMEYNAKRVRLEVVFSVRKCGIFFNFMLELAKNLNATYHVAGLWINYLSNLFLFPPSMFCWGYYIIYYFDLFRDLKEHLRRLQQQSDSRRRAAVMEMMRQRAAEVASNAGWPICT